ncbi:hypothetical protein KVR01_000132 [Diaporthe batatas]|uniref:uncharacterized protein n=1 Tax=Diaporthe batatas TaxID=748121 RepID=UPI001D042485|nr:uncharacterized protein KVR01_000132 [Diaporthe batatas]KAG8169387.1 hypothetical protein KVR01_000132 [Diaporthe batatas]
MSDPELEETPSAQPSKRRKRNDGSADHSSPEPAPQHETETDPDPPRNPPSPASPTSQRRSLSIRHPRPTSDNNSTPSRSPSRSDSASQSRSRSRSRPPPLRPNFQPSLELRGHEKPISQVRISPDGRWIASASADATAMIWDAETGAHMDTFVGHMAGVSCLAWSPDSETLATGSDDKTIRLWNRTTGDPAHAGGADDNAAAAAVGRIGTSARGIGGRTGDAGVRASGGRKPLLGHHNYLYCLAFSPKGNILASGSYDEAVFLWDVRAGRLMRSLPAHSDPVSGIDFCLDGTLVASCSTDGLIRIWDTATGQCLRTLVHEDNPSASSVCFSPNGRFVLASYTDSCVRLWDFINMPCAVKKTYQGHINEGYSVGGCFGVIRRPPPAGARGTSQNGHAGQLNGAGAGGAIEGQDPTGEETTGDEQDGQEQCQDEGVPFVASASEDGDVVMWDVRTKEIVQRISGAHSGVCFWVDVHSASGTMVTCGYDKRIVVHRHKQLESRPGAQEDGGPASVDMNGPYPPGEHDATAGQERLRVTASAQVNGENGHDHDEAELCAGSENAVNEDVPMTG